MGKKGNKILKEDKEQPQWSEKVIQKAIKWQILSPSTIKYEIENLNVFDWESDSLFITRSGYIYECEIKISRNDFKHDFKKKKKHLILEGKDNFEQSPNYFYYVVPKDLITVDEIPEYAGLIYVDVFYDFNGKISGYPIKFVKTAPIIHKDKIDLNTLNLTDKFYFNYINWKEVAKNKDKQIENLEKEIKNILTSESDVAYNYNLKESKKIIDEQNQRIDVLKKQINDEEYNSKYYFERSRIFQRLLIRNYIDYEQEVKEFNEKFDKEYGKKIDKK